MANVEDSSVMNGAETVSGMAKPASLLMILGEPFTLDQRDLILEQVSKGLACWDNECDLSSELQSFISEATQGEDGLNGEKILTYQSAKLIASVLINPQVATLTSRLRQWLGTPSSHRHLVHSGLVLHSSGSWILQDNLFHFSTFATLFKEADIENELKSETESTVTIHTVASADWSQAHFNKQSFIKYISVKFNPEQSGNGLENVSEFLEYIGKFVKVKSCRELLRASDVVGNIRFSKPTLYIFPGAQGDSALFGISGFNLLVNAGYNRKACFWDFTRHLDRIDALLLTHVGPDNIFGASSVFERKAQDTIHPEVGFVYFNAVERAKNSPNGDLHPENGGCHKAASLVINLTEQANLLTENLSLAGQPPHPCVGHIQGGALQPINLYLKVGHGSLDMYVLNPLQESKELKDFLGHWSKNAANFPTTKTGIPLPNMVSVSALLVWRPASPLEKITRILFPGSIPQAKLFEGLDKLKTLDILKHAACSEESLHAPKVTKKPPSAGAGKPATRTSKPAAPPARISEPRDLPKKEEKKPNAKSAPIASKPAKDAKNTRKVASKDSATKEEKKSPSVSSASSKKSSPASTPRPAGTPTNTPVDTGSPEEKISQDLAKPELSAKSEDTPPEVAPAPEVAIPAASVEPEVLPVKLDEAPPMAAEMPPPDVVPQSVPEPVIDTDQAPDLAQPSPVKEEPASVSEVEELPASSESHAPDVQPEYAAPEKDLEPEPIVSVEDVRAEISSGSQVECEVQAPGETSVPDVQPEALPEPDQFEVSSDFNPVPSHVEQGNIKTGVDSPTPLPDPGDFDAATYDAVAAVKPEVESEVPEMASDMASEVVPEVAPEVASEVMPEVEPEVESHMEPVPDVVPDTMPEVAVDDLKPEAEQHQEAESGKDRQKRELEEMGIYDDSAEVTEEDQVNVAGDAQIQEQNRVDDTPDVGQPEQHPSLEDMGIFDNEKHEVERDQSMMPPVGDQDADDVDEDSLVEPSDRLVAALRHCGGPSDSAMTDSLVDLGAPVAPEDLPPPVSQIQEENLNDPPKNAADSFSIFDGPTQVGNDAQMNPFVMGTNGAETNPFDIPAQMACGESAQPIVPGNTDLDRDSLERDEGNFDPIKEWGQPMGLPTPENPDKKAAAAEKKGKPTSRPSMAATKKPETKKPAENKPATATAKKAAPANATKTARGASATAGATRGTTATASKDAGKTPNGVKDAAAKKPAAKTTRPSSGPTAKAPTPTRPSAGAKRASPATTGRAPAAAKPVPLAPVTPYYMDLAYIPCHGDPQYVDLEFFRRVRARYYVLSTLNPSPAVLNAMVEAKQTWEDPTLAVTLIPTYDTDLLRHWMALNKDQLENLKIDVAPSASRCTIQLQDHETSCAAYRLEFQSAD